MAHSSFLCFWQTASEWTIYSLWPFSWVVCFFCISFALWLWLDSSSFFLVPRSISIFTLLFLFARWKIAMWKTLVGNVLRLHGFCIWWKITGKFVLFFFLVVPLLLILQCEYWIRSPDLNMHIYIRTTTTTTTTNVKEKHFTARAVCVCVCHLLSWFIHDHSFSMQFSGALYMLHVVTAHREGTKHIQPLRLLERIQIRFTTVRIETIYQ